jgi:hypothetical protein
MTSERAAKDVVSAYARSASSVELAGAPYCTSVFTGRRSNSATTAALGLVVNWIQGPAAPPSVARPARTNVSGLVSSSWVV